MILTVLQQAMYPRYVVNMLVAYLYILCVVHFVCVLQTTLHDLCFLFISVNMIYKNTSCDLREPYLHWLI